MDSQDEGQQKVEATEDTEHAQGKGDERVDGTEAGQASPSTWPLRTGNLASQNRLLEVCRSLTMIGCWRRGSRGGEGVQEGGGGGGGGVGGGGGWPVSVSVYGEDALWGEIKQT